DRDFMMFSVCVAWMIFFKLGKSVSNNFSNDDHFKELYQWNEDEKFLFRATIAFAMRAYTKDESYNVSSVLICNETQRVSFWIQVKRPNTAIPVQQDLLEKAIISSRNRINSAFLLSDKTLDVACCIGVVIGIVTLGIIAIIVSGVLAKKRSDGACKTGEAVFLCSVMQICIF
uniref:Collectrin, amino acid transport regulator n=1 Tax=Erpetoichthys calabaricus TaxID=27687 RepID=A0A8C4RHT3_ERPCA